MAKKIFKISLALLAVILLVGCCSTPTPVVIRKTIEVEVPVYLPVETPESLLKPIKIAELPVFYLPGTRGISSCLKPKGELNLKQVVFLLSARINEWLIFSGGKRINNE